MGCMADWTPVGGWRGVQIVDLGQIGRQLGVGVASRFGLYGGLDATYGLRRRPDSWWLLIWTPVGCRRGVQIVDLGRIGRQLGVGAASRLGLYGRLDASWVLARRQDWESRADWTPVGCWRGVQIWVIWRIGRKWVVGVAVQIVDLGRNGRHLRVGAASRFGLYGGLDASDGLGRRPDWESRADWTPVGCRRSVQIWVVWRIGCQLRAGAASRFLVVAGLDACCAPAWRPDWESRADWTPVGGWRGVQIGGCRADWTPLTGWGGIQIWALGRIGRHCRVCEIKSVNSSLW